jgi:hypothetical protein
MMVKEFWTIVQFGILCFKKEPLTDISVLGFLTLEGFGFNSSVTLTSVNVPCKELTIIL